MKKNNKGFSLVELLGVIVVVGILMGLGVGAVTRIVENSRREAFINAIKIQKKGVENLISNANYYIYDEDTAYYFDYKLTTEDEGGRSPYSDWLCAYVIVTYDGKNIKYYWAGKDNTGWTLTDEGQKKEIDKLTKKDMKIDSSKTCPQNPASNSPTLTGQNQKIAYLSNGKTITGGSKNDVKSSDPDIKNCYTYELLSDGTYKINSYSASCSKKVNVPGSIDGITVTVIGESAFAGLGITEVYLHNGVTKIANAAFKSNKIKVLELPATLKTIEDYAFLYNRPLSHVYFPEGLESIGYESFMSCGLTSVELPNSVTYVAKRAFYDNYITSYDTPTTAVIDVGAFTKNKLSDDDSVIYTLRTDNNGKEYYEATSYGGTGKTVKIKKEYKGIPVKSIGNYAFLGCGLTEVKLPDSIEKIGAEAFYKNELKEIKLPSGLITISKEAFRENYLSDVEIPSTVTSIGAAAFTNNCFTDENAIIYARTTKGIDYTTMVSVGTGKSKDDCKGRGGNTEFNLKNYLIKEVDGKKYLLKKIPTYAFEGAYLTNIILPSNDDMKAAAIAAGFENDKKNWLTVDPNAFWLNSVTGENKFIHEIFQGEYNYAVLDSYAGGSKGLENGTIDIPATKEGKELTTIRAFFSWSSAKTIKIPATVTDLSKSNMTKHGRSNPNLSNIIYNGQAEHNWYKLTGSNMAPSDITQSQTFTTNRTVRHQNGDIVISPN